MICQTGHLTVVTSHSCRIALGIGTSGLYRPLVAGQCRLRFTLRTMRIRVSLRMVSASHLHLVGVGTVTSGLFNILASTTIEVCAALSNKRLHLTRAPYRDVALDSL